MNFRQIQGLEENTFIGNLITRYPISFIERLPKGLYIEKLSNCFHFETDRISFHVLAILPISLESVINSLIISELRVDQEMEQSFLSYGFERGQSNHMSEYRVYILMKLHDIGCYNAKIDGYYLEFNRFDVFLQREIIEGSSSELDEILELGIQILSSEHKSYSIKDMIKFISGDRSDYIDFDGNNCYPIEIVQEKFSWNNSISSKK